MGRCCVPGCKGNYDRGPKVHVFSFPRDVDRKDKWLRAIPRKDFTPSVHSKVCELHFHTSDFVTTLTHCDESTGRRLEVTSDRVRLREDAVPTVFPNCPAYLTTTPAHRESLASKRARMDSDAIAEAIRNSLETEKAEEAKNSVSSFDELKRKLTGVCNTNFWTVVVNDENAVAYVAGYCAHVALKKLSCESCCAALVLEDRDMEAEDTQMIRNISRGGLKFPQPSTVHMVLITKLAVEKLTSGSFAKDFLANSAQRSVVLSTTMSVLRDSLEIETCSNGHTPETVMRLVVHAATHTLLNNFCKVQNDAVQYEAQKKAAMRKANTLKKK